MTEGVIVPVKFYALVLCSTGLAALIASPASAQSAEDAATKFGARESIRSISLSPDGKQVVLVGPRPDGGENAVVVNLTDSGSVTPILSSTGGNEQLTHCQFILETRVICGIYVFAGTNRDIDSATRLASISTDGKDVKLLTARDTGNVYVKSRFGGSIIDYNVAGNPNAVLMTRWFPPAVETGTLMGRSSYGLAVEQVDVLTLSRKLIEPARATAFSYLSDGKGSVRLMATQPVSDNGYAKRELNYQFRPIGGRWTPLSQVTFDSGISTGFEPVAVDSTLNVTYGFDHHNGHQALFKRALDGSGSTTLVLGRSDADVDRLIEIGRAHRVVGASYAIEKRTVEFFDPELKRLTISLARALGAGKAVSIVDSSSDENKLLVFAGSDTDPGMFYLYDKTTHALGELLPARPELSGIKLAEMKPVQYPAADGTMIPGYLTLPPGSAGKNIPAIVMPHGGPSSRDEWGFDWLVQFFANRGYAVLQPNYRGSAGFGSQWFQKNGFQSWQTAISDVNSAARWLQAQGIAAPGKLAIFGWSYGGYAALQSAVLDPDVFKAIVAVAPVTDLDQLREESRYQSDFFTTDNFIGTGPHVESGSPARHAAAFKAPVLLIHGDADQNVAVGESRLMANRLTSAGKQVEYIEFPGQAHQLDNAAARTRMLSASDTFIRKALGL